MTSLADVLKDPKLARAAARDGAKLVESEVASKRGMRGMALKAGYAALKKIKPTIIEEAVFMLLPSFAPAVDPHWEKACATEDPCAYMGSHRTEVANSMLDVTDELAKRIKTKAIQKTYFALRPQAQRHTEDAIPGLAKLILNHTK